MTRGNFPTAQGEIAGAADTEARGQVGLHFRFREGALRSQLSPARCSRLLAQKVLTVHAHMPCARYLDFGKGATLSLIKPIRARSRTSAFNLFPTSCEAGTKRIGID